MFKSINVPTLLTLARLIISPLVLPILLVYLLPLNHLWINAVLAIIFVCLSLTDFFDGYLARKYNQETTLGRLLDPMADKCLTYSALIALLAAQKIFFYWVVLLIGRELFIMGLRSMALEHNCTIPVSLLGKLKTFVLMGCITFIIINPYQYLGLHAMRWNAIECGLLTTALLISLLSAQQYYEQFMRCYRERVDCLPQEEQNDHY